MMEYYTSNNLFEQIKVLQRSVNQLQDSEEKACARYVRAEKERDKYKKWYEKVWVERSQWWWKRDDLRDIIKGKDQQIFRLTSQQDADPNILHPWYYAYEGKSIGGKDEAITFFRTRMESAEKARDKLKKEFQDLTDRYTQCCNANMMMKNAEEGYHRSYDYDSSDATETPSQKLKWQDVVLIGVFASTFLSALAGLF